MIHSTILAELREALCHSREKALKVLQRIEAQLLEEEKFFEQWTQTFHDQLRAEAMASAKELQDESTVLDESERGCVMSATDPATVAARLSEPFRPEQRSATPAAGAGSGIGNRP